MSSCWNGSGGESGPEPTGRDHGLCVARPRECGVWGPRESAAGGEEPASAESDGKQIARASSVDAH